MALGIGEAPNFPTGGRVVRDWFNRRERGMAAGVFNSASYVGTCIASPLLTALMLAFGWRWMFAIMGIAGLGAAVLWYAVYRDPEHMQLTEAENAYRKEGDAQEVVKPVTFGEWGRLFRCRTTWGMIFGYFGVIYVGWIFNAWLPAYLEIARHMDVKTTGWLSAVPYIFAIIGALSAGFIVDALMARGVSLVRSRQIPLCVAMVIMAFFVLAAVYTPSTSLAITFICVAMFCSTVSTTSAWAMAAVIAPSNCTGSLGSMQNFGGYLGGALAPMVTGFLVEGTGSFVSAFIVGAAMCIFAAVAFATIRRPITPEDLLPRGTILPAQAV